MKKRLLLLSLSLQATLLLCADSVRTTVDMTFGWRFHAGDTTGAAAVATKDGAWRLVDLPHDFQIEQPWVAPDAAEEVDNSDPGANITSRLSGRGFKEMGKGWYRYHLTPHDSLRGRRLLLDFAGIMYVGDVYLNGELIGGTDYGYVGFEIDVTNKLRFGRDNVIAVMADTRNPENSRWYTGGGLIRGVKFVATQRDLFLARYPLRITTRENRFVSVSVEYTNRTRSKEIPVRLQIVSPDGKTVYDNVTTVRNITASRTVEYKLPVVEVCDAQLWDTEHPNLYTAKVSLLREDGTVADDYEEHFGIRTVEFGPSFGMKLNGRKVLLKGYANHHSLGALGAAAYPRAIEKRILLMKQFGINHIRTSHNPYSREFIELCDKYGILVVDELYDKWTRQYTGGRVPFEQLWQKDVPEWVKRDRNSPSVILWSLGNELQQDPNQPFNDFGVTMYRLMRVLVNRYDSTRLTTVAMHPRYRSWETDSLPCELAKVTDIQAYNYRYMYFPGDGRRFPWMTFYQSEASVAAMGQNYFEMDLNKVIGMAYWGAIDYLGESQGWPAKGWPQGIFDIALNPKPKAYYMKSYFVPDEPLVHIGVVDRKGSQPWNGVQTGNDSMSDHWNRQPGQRLSLITYTNAEEVELILNGKSLGTQSNNIADPKVRNQIRWNNVVFEPGYIEAVARTAGKVVARHRIETTGKPAALVAQADNDRWQADGVDLQHIDVRIVDDKGRIIQTIDDEVTFEVEGDARIVGVINGYIASNEMTVGNKRRLFNGHCTVILRAGRKPGKVTLSATVDGLKTTKVKLQTL
jgi:beta-galactosidase